MLTPFPSKIQGCFRGLADKFMLFYPITKLYDNALDQWFKKYKFPIASQFLKHKLACLLQVVPGFLLFLFQNES